MSGSRISVPFWCVPILSMLFCVWTLPVDISGQSSQGTSASAKDNAVPSAPRGQKPAAAQLDFAQQVERDLQRRNVAEILGEAVAVGRVVRGQYLGGPGDLRRGRGGSAAILPGDEDVDVAGASRCEYCGARPITSGARFSARPWP